MRPHQLAVFTEVEQAPVTRKIMKCNYLRASGQFCTHNTHHTLHTHRHTHTISYTDTHIHVHLPTYIPHVSIYSHTTHTFTPHIPYHTHTCTLHTTHTHVCTPHIHTHTHMYPHTTPCAPWGLLSSTALVLDLGNCPPAQELPLQSLPLSCRVLVLRSVVYASTGGGGGPGPPTS